MTAPRPLGVAALERQRRRLDAADAPAWLHTEVARRMAERLPIIRTRPDAIVDWHAFRGASQSLLAQAYPAARVLAVEADDARRDATALQQRVPWWSTRRWRIPAPDAVTEAELSALAPGQAQLLWSNMSLQYAADPQAVMKAWHRALAVDGFLMFSTLGPGSLGALREIYTQARWAPPFAPFVDMHDLGDMLVEAGFAEPVMDQEQLTLTWASADAALAELRQLGGNVDAQRHAGLRTPRWRRELVERLEAGRGADGRVGLVFELVYGHAFRPPPRPRLGAQTDLPLEDMRAMIRAGRRAR